MGKELYVPSRDKTTRSNLKGISEKIDLNECVIPWTDKQRDLHYLLQRNAENTTCCFIEGLAGTSKTMCAVFAALNLLKHKKISKIFYVRSAVESSSNRIGFLKGSAEDKLAPYQSPLDDKLNELLPKNIVQELHDKDLVVMESTCFLRGRNLADCVVIVDEAQNLSEDELVTITSRVAEQARVWFCYDPKQSDLGFSHKKDIVKFQSIFDDEESRENGIHHFKFTKDDIVRSEFCKFVMGKIEERDERVAKEKFAEKNGFDSSKIKTDQKPPLIGNFAEEWSPSSEKSVT